MIDTHSHLLPGLDDGASTIEQALAMAAAAVDSGITEIICTPHLRDPEDPAILAPGVLEETREVLRSNGIPLRLHLGYELGFSFVTFLVSSNSLELDRFTMGEGSKAVLVEVPHAGWPSRADEIIFKLRLQGLLPVLAHPERNDRVQRKPELLAELLRLGAVAQGTVASLEGEFGSASRRCLLRQMSAGQISLFATDAHYHRRSSWTFARSAQSLAKRFSPRTVDELVSVNPGRILKGEQVQTVEVSSRRRSWNISFWKS